MNGDSFIYIYLFVTPSADVYKRQILLRILSSLKPVSNTWHPFSITSDDITMGLSHWCAIIFSLSYTKNMSFMSELFFFSKITTMDTVSNVLRRSERLVHFRLLGWSVNSRCSRILYTNQSDLSAILMVGVHYSFSRYGITVECRTSRYILVSTSSRLFFPAA